MIELKQLIVNGRKARASFLSILTFCIPLLFATTTVLGGNHKKITIYLSTDRTGTKASGISIEQGIRTALSEVGNKLGGRDVSLEIMDHHGSTPRAKKHLQKYLNDPTALVLFSGLHSPPLLATREYIHTNGILVLDPWAAAGPITRYSSGLNWIFRLSIDDTKAGYVITNHAVKKAKIKKPALLLEQTGWGKSNQKTMTRALLEKGLAPAVVKWFNWGLTEEGARILLRDINQSGADALFLVANAPEGKVIVRAMKSMHVDQRLPIFSHWGITGGDFSEVVGHEIRKQINLDFIQTKFSFLDELTPFQQQVLEQARNLFPKDIQRPEDIKAPSGFIHAYDLTRILIAAVNQVGMTGDMKVDRPKLRTALEGVDLPVEGLIKTYNPPFSRYSADNPDAHEALGIDDFTMAHYGPNNEILIEHE
ncbi:MAG: ABC transporter substrate-binding protein [Gammaproteobacteria bacterium]|nr:ABC transporter substrate-binding protein [Gammaproteobacteria bacterium]